MFFDDDISDRLERQAKKDKRFRKLDKWQQKAVIADKKRRAELNREYQENHRNPYSAATKNLLMGASVLGASNILMHRTGMHEKINKPLAKLLRAKKAMSMKTGGKPWYRTTISDWKKIRKDFKSEWKKADEALKENKIRIDRKKGNSFFTGMIKAQQLRGKGMTTATQAWSFYVEDNVLKKLDAVLPKEGSHNRRNKFANFVRDLTRSNDPITRDRGFANFTSPEDLDIAKKLADEINALNNEQILRDPTKYELASEHIRKIDDHGTPKVVDTLKKDFLRKHSKENDVYADLLENIELAREHFGYLDENEISVMDKLRGTRKATMGDILDNLDDIEDFKVRVTEKNDEDEFVDSFKSFKSIIKENLLKARKEGKEEEFRAITPDSMIRINTEGKIYSAEGTEGFVKEFLESVSDTLPGKIIKIRDTIRNMDQPVFNLAFKGSLDPILAAATNETTTSKKSGRLDNTVVKAYDRWYKINENGEAVEFEHMRGKYNIASGKSNFLYNQIHLMHDDARRVESDNPIMHWLDLREDRDEYDAKSFIDRLMARMPWRKDEFSRNIVFQDMIKPSEGFMSNHIAGLDEIALGDNTYVNEVAKKIETIKLSLNENTYQLTDNVVEQLQPLVSKDSVAGQLLDILRESDEYKFYDRINDLQERMKESKQNFVDKDLLSWLNRQSLDQTASFNEYQVIVDRSHGQIGSDLSTSYHNESLKGINLIKKKLGKETLLQLGAQLAGQDVTKKSDVELYNALYDALDAMQNVTQKEKWWAKNLATETVFNRFFESIIQLKAEDGLDIPEKEAQDYVNRFFEFAANRHDVDFINEMKKSFKNISDEGFSRFDTYYANVDEVGNPLSYNNYITVHKSTGLFEALKNLNEGLDDENADLSVAKHFIRQFYAGRNNMEDVSYATMAPFFALTRLNEVGRTFGIGFSSRSMASTPMLFANIMLKRVVPTTIAATYLDWGNDTTQEITGQSFTGAGLRGLAQTDVAFRRGMDAVGLTDWLKEEKQINPIMQYWGDKNDFYNADELQDYYDNGYTPVRKGAYWTFGSVNELRGGEISYWAPTWVRKAESDYKDEALYDGYLDKWSHSLLPTPTNPISPIIGFLDPYWLERKHSKDRPYTVSGQLFDEGTPLGIMLNPTLGNIIKPQKELHTWRMNNGVDIYAAAYQANEWIKEKAASIGKRDYFTYDGADTAAVTFNAWNAPTSDTSVLSMNLSGGQYGAPIQQVYGVYDEEDGPVISTYAGKSGQVAMSGGFGTAPDEGFTPRSIFYDSGVPSYLKGEGYTQLTEQNAADIIRNRPLDDNHAIVSGLGNTLGYVAREDKEKFTAEDARFSLEDSLVMDSIINGDEGNIKFQTAQLIGLIKDPLRIAGLNNQNIKNRAASIKSTTEDYFDDNQGFLTAQKLKSFTPSQGMELLNDADTVAELINQGKGSSLVHDMAVSERLITGIYGYMSGEAFGIGTDQEKKIATSQDMTSTSRAFWDSGIGGAGGSTAEIVRRFIPDFRRRSHVNPMLNNMPDWMPERFRTGDPYTSIIDGEARLPGKGYEALNKLHPDAYGDYGAFDRFKILADIAPFTPEYKLWKEIAAKTVSDPHLIEEMDEIRDRVAQQGKKHDFYNNNFFDSGVVYKDVIISELMDHGKFKSGDQVYKLAGISLTTNGDATMKETLGKYLRVGDEVTIAIDKNEAYQRNTDSQKSINAAVFRDTENINKQILEAGDARVRKGDTSAPAFLTRYTATQRLIAEASEKIGHLDIPWLSDQYLRIRTPLESYDAEVLYGTPYQTWSHPIDTFLVPAVRRAFHDSGVLSGASTYLYNKAVETPGIGKFSKAGATALYMFSNRGAFIGGALGAVVGLRQPSIELGARLGQSIAQGGHLLTGGDSYADMTLNGAVMGYEIANKLEKNSFKGAAIGSAAAIAYRKFFGDEGVWKPSYVKKKWAMEEYFDRLTYIKYSALYHEAARRAKDEEGVDVEKIVTEREEQYSLAKDIKARLGPILGEIKAKTYDKESDASEKIKKKLKKIYGKIYMSSDEIFEGGEWTRAALLYRKAAKSTVYAMDKNTSWKQMIAALPKNDREYFMEFVKEADPSKRKEILDHVSPSLNKALRLSWKMDVKQAPSNQEYFETHNLPTPYWTGWHPDTDIEDIELKTIANEGMNLSDFGYYESQLEDKGGRLAPPVKHWNQRNDAAENVKRNLTRILKGKGLKNLDISVDHTIGGTNIVASIKRWAGIKENQPRVDDAVRGMMV